MFDIFMLIADTIITLLKAGFIEMFLSFGNTPKEDIVSCVIIAIVCLYAFLRQRYYRKLYHTGTGWKRYKGYLHYNFIRHYIWVFLLVFLMHQNNNLAIHLFFFLYVLKRIADILMKLSVQKEVDYLKQNLTQESRILIFHETGCVLPGEFWIRLYDILLVPTAMRLLNIKLLGSYRNYIAVNHITALICEDLIKEHPKYMYHSALSFRKLFATPNKLMVHICKLLPLHHSCEMHLVMKDDRIALDSVHIPFPKETLQFTEAVQDSNWISHIVNTIEKLSKESTGLEMRFRPFLSYETREPGKRYAQSMIKSMLDTIQNDTEYFYSLLKLNEFMIHYQALADYETAKNRYWDAPDCTPSMGVFANNITDTIISEHLKEDDFKDAVRFIHNIATGHSERFPTRRPSYYAREQLVVLRNRYMGHGTMTYSVSRELLQQFSIVTQVLTEQFFLQEEEQMLHTKIDSVDKLVEKDSRLYLLSALYRSNQAYQYLDYATGHTLSLGKPLTIQLNRR